MSTPSSLLLDVLRQHSLGVDKLTSNLAAASLQNTSNSPPAQHDSLEADSEDELVGVTSMPGTPLRSRAPSRSSSRTSSPTRSGASKRRPPGPLLLPKGINSDPLRAFPTEVSQRVFGLLDVADLARCARVCKKWDRSQTLNYVWFQQHRKGSFHDESLPSGRWTRRESKQNWRQIYNKEASQRDKDLSNTIYVPPSRTSRPNSPFVNGGGSGSASGYTTPREAREESWRQEAEAQAKPGKVEMRELYKELNGRKARGKGKFGASTSGSRVKGGWGDGGEDGW